MLNQENVDSRQSGGPTLLQLLRMGRTAEGSLSRVLMATDLTPDQFQILVMIDERPEVSAVVIAQALDLDAPTVSRQVNRLAQRGLLERRRAHKDRRLVRLSLTPGGRGLVGEAREAVATADQEFMEQLGAAERRVLERLLSSYSS